MKLLPSLPGSGAEPPSAVSRAPGRLDVFAVGPTKTVWQWSLEGAVWIGPIPLAPTGLNGVANIPPGEGMCAVSSGDGRIEVFAAGSSGNTPWWWRFDGTGWKSPVPLPGAPNLLPVPITAITSGPDNIDVFAVGVGNTPWWWHWSGGPQWVGPTTLPSAPNLPPERIAVVSAGPGRLDVFAAGRNGNQLWHWWLEPTGWRVEPLGGNLPAEGVTAVSWGPGRIDVFAVNQGQSANALHHWSSNGAGFTEDVLGGDLVAAAVSAVSTAPNRLDVFGISRDGRLARWQWDGHVWYGPTYQGRDLLPGDVSAAIRAPNRIDVFVRGMGNSLLQWPGGGLENARSGSWTNWPGTQGPITVEGLCRPGSLEELVTIVREAEQRGRRVRAVGSGWSGSDIAMTADYLVETDQLNSIVTEVLDPNSGILLPDASNPILVHVEAGIKLVDLNRYLDRRDLAMKTLGGSSGQSLAGALSTSVHGADINRGPLPDVIRAIHLVGPGGTQHWIEPGAGITDPDRLSAALGLDKANIHYDDDWFNSVVVSMGAMGIIYSLIVEVEPQYDLKATCTHLTWDAARAGLRAGTPFAGNRAVQVVISQFKHDDGTRPAFLTTRVEERPQTKPAEGGLSPDLTTIIAEVLVRVLNASAEAYPDAVKTVLFQSLPAEKTTGWAHTVMTAPPPPPAQGLGLEFAFDANNDAYLTFVDAALQLLDDAYQNERLGWGGWVSLRFVGWSRAYLSPQHQFTRTCMAEFTAATQLASTKELLPRLEALGKAHGGIQHWGMFYDLNASDVARAYPNLDTWRQVRSELTHGGTIRTFDNEFTRRCGLSESPMRVSPVCVTSWGPDRLDVFGLRVDRSSYHKAWTGSAWAPGGNGWEPLGGTFISAPTAVAWGHNRLDIFGVGVDRAIHHKAWTGNAWAPGGNGWEPLGGTFVSPPTAVAWGPNRLDIFALGVDRSMYHKAWTGNEWAPGGSEWQPLGGTFVSPPTAVAWGLDRLDIFGLGVDRAMYHKAWTGNAWAPGGNGWEPLGGTFIAPPTAVAWGPNRLDIFAVGLDGAMYHKAWTNDAWAPAGNDWERLGGTFIGAPTAVAWDSNRLDIFGLGGDRAMYHKAWTNNAWAPGGNEWEPLGGTFISPPTAVAWAPNRLDIFGLGLDRAMHHKAWTGNTWAPGGNGWEPLGGTFITP